MLQHLAPPLAALCRAAPFERGRWRIGSLASRLIESAPLPPGRRTVATRHGFAMSLALGEHVDRSIWCQGEWEPLQTRLIGDILRPGDRFVDVGANIGYFSLLAARCVGPQGSVTAIEANADTHALLKANLALNGCANVDTRLVAVGEAPGRARIVSPEAGNAGADRVAFDADGAGTLEVERLDSLLGSAPVRLIKIDIEGAEAKAIRGAGALLEGSDAPDLVFEFTPEFLSATGDDPAALLGHLIRLGYRVSELTNHGLRPPAPDILSRRQTYLYCTKRG
jgi:FkbM family methyltransferase